MTITLSCRRCPWTRPVYTPSLDDWTGEDVPDACPACGGVVEATVTNQGAFR